MGRDPQFHIIPFFKIKEENENQEKDYGKSLYEKHTPPPKKKKR